MNVFKWWYEMSELHKYEKGRQQILAKRAKKNIWQIHETKLIYIKNYNKTGQHHEVKNEAKAKAKKKERLRIVSILRQSKENSLLATDDTGFLSPRFKRRLICFFLFVSQQLITLFWEKGTKI